jgi:hypothetical protein
MSFVDILALAHFGREGGSRAQVDTVVRLSLCGAPDSSLPNKESDLKKFKQAAQLGNRNNRKPQGIMHQG